MKKKILIVLLTSVLTILQFSLYLKNIRINLLLLFLVYLIFFENINYSLTVVGFGLLIDLFAVNFGSYFISFLLVAIFLHYIYHNILGNNKLFTYLLINFFALLIFYSTYYIYNFFIRLINQGFYFFDGQMMFKNFLISLIIHSIFALLLYALTNIFSYKEREKFTIIGD